MQSTPLRHFFAVAVLVLSISLGILVAVIGSGSVPPDIGNALVYALGGFVCSSVLLSIPHIEVIRERTGTSFLGRKSKPQPRRGSGDGPTATKEDLENSIFKVTKTPDEPTQLTGRQDLTEELDLGLTGTELTSVPDAPS